MWYFDDGRCGTLKSSRGWCGILKRVVRYNAFVLKHLNRLHEKVNQLLKLEQIRQEQWTHEGILTYILGGAVL